MPWFRNANTNIAKMEEKKGGNEKQKTEIDWLSGNCWTVNILVERGNGTAG